MKTITLNNISFGSFLKLCVLIFVSGALAIGFIFLVLSIVGANVYVFWGAHRLVGIEAGLTAFFIFPIVWALVGMLFSCVSFFPFKLMLCASSGLSLNAELIDQTDPNGTPPEPLAN